MQTEDHHPESDAVIISPSQYFSCVFDNICQHNHIDLGFLNLIQCTVLKILFNSFSYTGFTVHSKYLLCHVQQKLKGAVPIPGWFIHTSKFVFMYVSKYLELNMYILFSSECHISKAHSVFSLYSVTVLDSFLYGLWNSYNRCKEFTVLCLSSGWKTGLQLNTHKIRPFHFNLQLSQYSKLRCFSLHQWKLNSVSPKFFHSIIGFGTLTSAESLRPNYRYLLMYSALLVRYVQMKLHI